MSDKKTTETPRKTPRVFVIDDDDYWASEWVRQLGERREVRVAIPDYREVTIDSPVGDAFQLVARTEVRVTALEIERCSRQRHFMGLW